MESTLPQGRHNLRPSNRRIAFRGTTLIDLVICILVMGILAAIGVPRFASTVSRLRCEAVAKRIASDLNYARRVAIQTSRVVTVTFRNEIPGYDMTGVTNPANPSALYSVNLSDVDSSVALAGINFNSGSSFSYNNYGRPQVGTLALSSGSVTVSSGEHSFVVVVSVTTGEAVVQ